MTFFFPDSASEGFLVYGMWVLHDMPHAIVVWIQTVASG